MHQLLWVSNMMLIAGLCLVTSLFSRRIDSLFFSVLLFGYLILFPAILMVWLALPHRIMLQARDEHLQMMVNEYNKTLQEREDALREPTSAIAEGTERLVTLQKRYNQVKESFPTWPVEISLTSKLGVTLFLPLLTSFIPAIINLITKLVK